MLVSDGMFIKAMGWLGTLVSIIGSFAVAFGYMFPGYCYFVFGAVCWLTVAAVKRDYALAALNGFFFIANIIGLIRNFH